MKKQFIKIVIVVAVFNLFSCTEDFEAINTNSTGQSEITLPDLFKGIYSNIVIAKPEWQYQLQQNLNADLWSGYMATPTGFAGGSNNSTYNLIDGWNDFAWAPTYKNVIAFTDAIERKTKNVQNDFYALSLLLKVQAMHKVTDTFGPAVYSQYGTGVLPVSYDSQEEIYNAMFTDLETAITHLTNKIQSGEPSNLAGVDKTVYAGDMTKWVKFGNSLRLRLAMRITKINPVLAKTEAEKSLAHTIGVITENNEILSLNIPHPVGVISEGWKDIRMSADMESILVGYSDPRLSKYFKESVQFPSQYKGVRTGINIISKSDHQDFSGLSDEIVSKITFMTVAEVYFLRAEGALRGWNMGGISQLLYEEGVKKSFEQHAATNATAYLADNSSVPTNYVDTAPGYAVNNTNAVSAITIEWNDIDTNELKLERIITQKWIACFPDGQEAWSEHRRTGYPKLFPVIKNTSGGIIDSNLGVRRINFPISEVNANAAGVASGVSKLNGPDNGATRLWWDTTGSNF